MFFKYTIYLALLSFILMACNNEANNNSNPITDTLSNNNQENLKEKTYCYNLYNYDIQELLHVINENGNLNGETQGIINGEAINFSGVIGGKCNNDTCKVVVSRAFEFKYPNQVTNEVWVYANNEYKVIEGMQYPNMTATDFIFRPVRCFKFDPKAKFDAILEFKDGFAPVIQNDIMGVIDSNYNIVIPIEYEYLSHINEGSMAFKPQGEMMLFYGVIDLKGNVIIESDKSYATPFYDGLSAVVDDKGFYFIDTKGKIAIPANNYQSILSSLDFANKTAFISEGLIAISKDYQWGFIDKKGNIVIPFMYDAVEHFKNSEAIVQKGKKSFTINRNNKCINNCN